MQNRMFIKEKTIALYKSISAIDRNNSRPKTKNIKIAPSPKAWQSIFIFPGSRAPGFTFGSYKSSATIIVKASKKRITKITSTLIYRVTKIAPETPIRSLSANGS